LALAASAFWISFSASASVFSADADLRQGTPPAWDRGQGAGVQTCLLHQRPSSGRSLSLFFLFSRAFFIAIAAAALPGILSAAGPAQH